jgi:maleate isomerase
MIPSSNTMMEVDFQGGLPPHARLHTARMFMKDTTAAGENRMLDDFALPAARDLATANPHVVVFGCTSAGALRGNRFDAELCDQISEITGVPSVSTIQSVRIAIRTSGARRIAVITPYVDELNDKIKISIEADDIEVSRIAGMGITDNFAIAQVSAEEIVAFAESSVAGSTVDLIFASCTNFAALSAIGAMQDRLHLPVITSNQAVLAATVSAFTDAAPSAAAPTG